MTGPNHPTGRARISSRHPQALAICDRCSFTFNRVNLIAQREWSGTKLQTYNILVCKQCYDIPQQQLRTIVIPPDPVPILNPRPEQYRVIEPSYMATATNQLFVTTSGVNIIAMIRVTPTPVPPGYLNG